MVMGQENIGPPEKGGGVIDDLIESNHGKIGKLHFDDGTHAFYGRPDRRANHCVLADGGVHHAPWKFPRQIFRGLECPAKSAHVLAINEHPRIVLQCLRLGRANRFEIGYAHKRAPVMGANME